MSRLTLLLEAGTAVSALRREAACAAKIRILVGNAEAYLGHDALLMVPKIGCGLVTVQSNFFFESLETKQGIACFELATAASSKR